MARDGKKAVGNERDKLFLKPAKFKREQLCLGTDLGGKEGDEEGAQPRQQPADDEAGPPGSHPEAAGAVHSPGYLVHGVKVHWKTIGENNFTQSCTEI